MEICTLISKQKQGGVVIQKVLLEVLDECDVLVFVKIVSYAWSHSITHLMSQAAILSHN